MINISIAQAESIEYEIYEQGSDSQTLIAKGTRTYTASDVKISPYESEGQRVAEKMIELEKGYKVGARIFYEKKLTGFGLLAEKSKDDFSWNWYDQVQGKLFKKLKGKGTVEVKVSGLPMYEELSEVKFLEDTYLSFKESDNNERKILIKAGSVFRF